ncbi:MAG TPA: hypothetical protein VGM59_13270 [Dongiaceae bacterium]
MLKATRLEDRLPPYGRKILRGFSEDRIKAALAAMRPPSAIMTVEALRLVKASPFSFVRGLVDRMSDERWQIQRVHCEVDAHGAGLIVYRVRAEGRTLTFATRSVGLEPVERSGRIKDNELDFYGALFDGEVGIEQIKAEAEEQLAKVWRGRTDNSSLGWTFANRSNRSFDYTIDALCRGQQPDVRVLAGNGGYLIRNAGFYGNGRHGCRSWQSFSVNHPLSDPYHVDLFCLYLWRLVGFDFVEMIARARNAEAVTLDSDIKRYIGVGNSSGIGMVAALVRWPHWMSGFCFAREFALTLALTEPGAPPPAQLDMLLRLLDRAHRYYGENDPGIDPSVEDRPRIGAELLEAKDLVCELRDHGTVDEKAGPWPLQDLMSTIRQRFLPGTSEQFASLVVETRSDLVKKIRPLQPAAMALRRNTVPDMSLEALRALIKRDYDWALDIDFAEPGARRYFWYRSEENGENRRGERAVDPGLAYETFVDVAGSIQDLYARIAERPSDWTTARYLVDVPDDIYLVSRIQFLAALPYGEIRSNLIDEAFRPSDLIQFYLSVLGMETTDPGNFRWVRGVFLQGAPLPEDVLHGAHRDWSLPNCPEPAAGLRQTIEA